MKQIELGEHQLTAIGKMRNGCILKGGVGTGKSRTAIAYYVSRVLGIPLNDLSKGFADLTMGDLGPLDRKPIKTDRPNILVITTKKKRDSLDWEEEALPFGISPLRSASLLGVSIKVDTWNNVAKYQDVTNTFVIFDEQRLVGSGAWVKAFYKIAKSNPWIVLSATPGDTWLEFIPVFVANGYYKNRAEFIRRHVVFTNYSKFPKVDHYVEVGRLVKIRNHILVEMPYLRHTVRHVKDVIVAHDEALFERVWKDRWHVYNEEPLRDVAEMFSVARRVVNSDPSRITILTELLKRHPRLIVFYNFNYELEALRALTQQLASNPSRCDSLKTTSSTLDLISTTGSKQNLESCEKKKQSNEQLKDGRLTKTDLKKPSTNGLTKPRLQLQTLNSTQSKLRVKSASDSDFPSHLLDSTETETSSGAPDFQVAEWNGQKHEPVPEGESWIYLVQYTAGAEGWNCIATDAEVFFSLNYSWKINEQAKGRIDRLNTPYTDLYYYILQSDSKIDKAILRALGEKRNFNEKDLMKEMRLAA